MDFWFPRKVSTKRRRRRRGTFSATPLQFWRPFNDFLKTKRGADPSKIHSELLLFIKKSGRSRPFDFFKRILLLYYFSD